VVNYVHFGLDQFRAGELKRAQGSCADELLANTHLVPAVGDVVLAVNSCNTTMTGFAGLQKLINGRAVPVTLTFRRYRHDLLQIVTDAEEYFAKINGKPKPLPTQLEVVVLDGTDAEAVEADDVAVVVQASERCPDPEPGPSL